MDNKRNKHGIVIVIFTSLMIWLSKFFLNCHKHCRANWQFVHGANEMTTIDNLSHTVQQWMRWMRLQRALTWAVRGLVTALVLSLLIGGVGLYQARLLKREFLALVITFVTLLPMLFGIAAFFWKIHPLKAARYFDRAFHLEERISTALEFSAEDHANEIIQKQLDDAVSASRGVKPSRDLPLRLKKMDGILALIFTLSIGTLWFRGETLFAAASRQRAVEQAITEQQAQIEEIIKEINANESLTDEQKQALAEPLQEALQGLEENPSLENAVSVLTNTGEKLQALSSEQAGQTAQALKETGSSLESQAGTPLESAGKDLANGDFAKAASDLQNMDLSQMSPEELQKLAEQLDAMAESLASTNPQMAEALKQAAEAIRNGDLATAQQALANASSQLANAGQQIASSQMANQAASQVQAGAGQLLAAGGQALAQGQANNQSGQNNGGSGSGSGSGDAPQSNQQGDEAGSSPIPQNNGAGDGGESAYEQIYAPSLLTNADGTPFGLPSSGTDGDVVGTSPTTAANGQSLVPYTNVFSVYEQFYYQAIENGEVPAQFYDLIRNYFISLK
jgi:predicted small integral membrane protein